MTDKRYCCSDEAYAFLQDNLPVPDSFVLSTMNIQQVRNETRTAYQANIDFAMAIFDGRLEETTIGGVDCLVVHPDELDPRWRDSRVLYYYGGGYIQGSPEEDLPISAFISKRLGIEVICPRYRLAPEHPYPCAHHDGRAVYRELLDSFDSKRLVIAGESAGGNLALSTLLNVHAEALPLPAACIMLSPWVDLTSCGDSLQANDGRDPTLTRDYVDQAAKLYAADTPLDDPAISPLFADLPQDFPPTLVTSGTRDLLLSQAVEIVSRLRAHGCEVELRVFEHMWHVFEFYPQIPEAGISLNGVCDFLESALVPMPSGPSQ